MYYLWSSVGISGSQWESPPSIIRPTQKLNAFVAPLSYQLASTQDFVVVATGTFQRTLDGKLRVLLPKKVRARLVDDVTAGDNLGQPTDTADLYLTPGTDACLELHTTESLNELAKQARQNNRGVKNIRSFSRLFYARAHLCEIDGQGRIRIPKELAELANLEKEVVFIGVGYHWEVWDQDSWNRFLAMNNDQFDAIVQSTFDAEGSNTPVADSPLAPLDSASNSFGTAEPETIETQKKGPSPR